MDKRYRGVVQDYMFKKAEELEIFMKSNHPWRNRTGNAEAGLSARLTSSRMNYVQTISLSHGVPYGVHLEYGMGRRFAIIEPTIRIKGPEIVDDLYDRIGMFANVKGV